MIKGAAISSISAGFPVVASEMQRGDPFHAWKRPGGSPGRQAETPRAVLVASAGTLPTSFAIAPGEYKIHDNGGK